MEGNLSGGNMVSGPSYGVLEMQGSLHAHQHHQHSHALHQNHQHHQRPRNHHAHHLQDMYPLAVPPLDCEPPLASPDFRGSHRNIVNGAKVCASDEDEPSFNEDGIDGHPEDGKGKKNSPWHRMKWTDGMVKLLISIVSYIGEDAASECSGGRKKLVILQKKGKWKTVSRVMAARGCYVSPQQCEDKFNDLNKRYKRLTDVLGRGTSCKVVENPALLDTLDHLSEKSREDVRKILSSKHLFYEEMCSYHNGNRLHLLDDPSLLQCLQSVLRGRDGREVGKTSRDENDCEDDGDETEEGNDDPEDNEFRGEDGSLVHKRPKIRNNTEDTSLWTIPNAHDFSKQIGSENLAVGEAGEMTQEQASWMQKEWIKNRILQLEEQKISIQAQALDLEAQRFKWQRFSRKKDRELDKLKLENERMKLENERFMLQLRRKELELGLGRSDASAPDPSHAFGRLPQARDQNEMERTHCI
ncbi:unnamed protein product [Victoria cruziana]